MNKRGYKKILIALIVIICIFSFQPTLAQFGLAEAGRTSGLSDSAISRAGDIPAVIGFLVSTVLSLVGVFFFLLILYAGFIWMTAAGSKEKVDSAKTKMVSAVIGLVIVLSAYALTSFVFRQFLDVTGDACPEECPITTACVGKECVPLCDIIYGKYGGTCMDIDECKDGIVLSGYCTGGINNKCCVPVDRYREFERSITNDPASMPSVPMPEKNACEKSGHFCVPSSSCVNSYSGRSIGQQGCASGHICCESCRQSHTGWCISDPANCVPPDDALSGLCFGPSAGQYCCTGDVL